MCAICLDDTYFPSVEHLQAAARKLSLKEKMAKARQIKFILQTIDKDLDAKEVDHLKQCQYALSQEL